MTKEELSTASLPTINTLQSAQFPHIALHHVVRLALADPNYMGGDDGLPPNKPILKRHWESLIIPGNVNSFNYGFTCRECNQYRVVRRDNLPPPENLLKDPMYSTAMT